MKQFSKHFSLSALSTAILCSLSMSVNAAEVDDEAVLEEVVVSASRLKGTATAVLEERKQQAFVADIMGAEQISRSGDSDAAGALRRVTGLTLVDGKFIYVRGLGERYSSTQLNSAAVPSPDPTRSVIPLDLFPAGIIESLSVQKSYSPSMPASFGGGNVDIRLKSIPNQFVFDVTGQLGYNSNNFDDGLEYNGGSDDWYGFDDGTREMPDSIKAIYKSGQSIDDVTPEQSRALALDLNRDYDPTETSLDPNTKFTVTLGNSFESGDWRYGFLSAVSYDNKYFVGEEYQGQDFRLGESTAALTRGYDKVTSSEHNVKLSGMFNFGIEYDKSHRIDISSLILRDTEDKVRDRLGIDENNNQSDNKRIRSYDISYEERELIVNQIKGTHTFDWLNFAGFDWKYSNGRSNRYAPGNLTTRFIVTDENEDGNYDVQNEIALTNATTAARYTYQDLNDEVENYGFNFTFPIMLDGVDIELKSGADFISKERSASNRRFDINTRAFSGVDLNGNKLNSILSDDVIANAQLNLPILNDTTVSGDDYRSAQKTDAYYFEADFFFNNKWRISGGIRWEDFRQVSVPLDPFTGGLDSSIEYDELADLAFQEDDVYGALAFTYVYDDETQYRLSYGETVVRPDLREISESTYIDPLTEYPVGGTPGLRTTQIKNYDFRWENYYDTGENFSVGLFYKDMTDPIESVQSPSQDGPPLVRIANAEEGYVAGIEFDYLKDFTFLGGIGQDIFLSGNVTLSDSEIKLDRQAIVDQTGVSAAVTNTKRRLTGHSKYVVNMQLGYDAPSGEHAATIIYNVFGERIIIPGIEGQEDWMEQPFHSVDLNYTYFPDFNSSIKFKVLNILGQDQKIEADGVLTRSKEKGTEFSVEYKYQF
ncbi:MULTISPECIES: TonB-dependent receptor domain-containing protein [Pseudoalteromonas]|uniref:TonB-dependent receptor n=1 Tax=Pseudoalteromonas fuliginea TaxID=1872678 RepID=A0ABD3Y963_9GAMM|nr:MULTISPECIES: TonB-dependent receptor [Pseudoalteromonas]ALQ10349.1 TonB-dependent receptor [Pseudoalteromonas sp. Bsw20308]KDC51081.1 TonB-dependent receptor [Pseudoalteromonas fuliginea]KDC53756.1 TonB-dependent receptor [Pseudoalteromonas sp. S3431]KJZ28487.1 TonB-dependent receptor [Pseudoalteromonas fuliginea]GAA81500.1 TonB-dependent receptor [Pseudoalteromonas sp. BSi20495]